MRIALYHNAPSGGAKRAIYEWTRRLAKNHEIDVYTLSTADHDFCDIRSHVLEHQVAELAPHRLFNSPFGRLNQLQRWRDLEKLIDINKRQAEEINRRQYDIVFAHTCRFTFIPPVLQFLKTPSVFYLHEPFGPGFSREIDRPYIKQNPIRSWLDQQDPFISMYRKRLYNLQVESLKRVSLLLSNSSFTQEQMKNNFGIDAPVSHYGVNLDSFSPQPEIKKKQFVVSVGEMSPRKGFDFIVESIGCIPDQIRPNIKLACNRIELPELKYVESLASSRQVGLEVFSNLNSIELAQFYNQAYLCVYAPVREPFGLVPLEAMACQTPVVGVNEGGIKESVVHEQTGLLVERDVEQFAIAIQQLLAQPEIVREYGRKGRRHVQDNWTWEKSTAIIEEHLISCAAESSSKNTISYAAT